MSDGKPQRIKSLLAPSLGSIRNDGARGLLRPPARWLPLLFLSALALWLVVSGVGSPPALAAVTNRGFETGDLTGWSTGTVTENVTVVGVDVINEDDAVSATPLEGQYMARLGDPQPSDYESQPMGPNELFQNFTISENALRFAYNLWTYDYTGYDEFRWEVRLTDTDTVIGTFQTEAWGTSGDTSRKTSGWQVVEVDTSAYQGRPARLSLSAAGTEDMLYAFWVYIDSAEETLAPGVIDYSGIKVNGFSPSRNPQTQTIFIRRPPGTGSNTIEVPVTCPPDCSGSTIPNSVTLIVSGPDGYLESYPMTDQGGDIWGVTFPTPPGSQGDTFTLTLRIDCCGSIITVTIGSLTLVDPSGFVTDAVSGAPIPEATVTLQRLDDSTWADVSPFETAGDPPSPTISPQVNPQLTDEEGHYGWDVIAGTYRVIVEKQDYVTQTSPEVTVPPPVTDLDIQLVPEGQEAAFDNCPQPGKWAISVWGGQDGTETGEALATCGAGVVDFAYYIDPNTQAWARYFADRPEITNLLTLQHKQGVIAHGAVGAAPVTPAPVAVTPQNAVDNCPQPGKWAISVWGGQDGTDTAQALETCGAGAVDFAYHIDPNTQAWSRYFAGRPEISNLLTLDQMQGVIAHGAVAPSPTPTPTPTVEPSPTPPGLACGGTGDSLSEIEEMLGYCLDDVAVALGLTRDELAALMYLYVNLGGVPPASSSVGSAWLVAGLPFLFLGHPDYDCSISASGSWVDCVTASLDWPDYTCSVSTTGETLDCTTIYAGWPEYSCSISSTGMAVECTTPSLDRPDYTCSLDLAAMTLECRTLSLEWPDYTCAISTTGETADCTTDFWPSPDFECTSPSIGSLSCRAY